eukprot:gnl/MRDRNA2_/MRDRNA2_309918_c0_seq1.p1 gnl/MRDRNA2_/MRDRNA2_309918_c0~~gnl/MRDRNA2_/MRDRNA2_309918_c0_seq1.p1  ORF type:complete len:149 (+),score=29.70 gnl/MRDRNA2_/MRDRNA2_309918_c0_seq1:43-447(+)
MVLGAFFFGWNAGSYVALTPPVVKDFMTLEELPQAAGLVYTAWGWTMMFGPPLAAYIYNQVSPPDYFIPFVVAGCLLILGAVILLLLEVVIARQKSQGDKDAPMPSETPAAPALPPDEAPSVAEDSQADGAAKI